VEPTPNARVPGPTGLPVLGSLLDIHGDPLGWLARLSRQYGPVARFNVAGLTRVLVSDPALVEDLLVRHQDHTTKDHLTRRLSEVLGDGLLTSEGDHWRTQRRRIAPSFQPRHVAGYGEVMVRSTLERLPAPGELDIHALASSLALDIVIRTLFGAEPGGEAERVGVALATLMEAFDKELRTVWRVIPAWVPGPHRAEVARAVAEIDALLHALVTRARRSDEGETLLARLLQARDQDGRGMTDQELRDELVTLFLAGHETTAIAISSALWLLAEHPEHQDRLRAEVDALGRDPTAADVGGLRFTDAVLRETMRLHPPAWGMGREVVRGFELGGYRLEPGTEVTVFPWGMHRDPALWVGPERFRPDRWLNGETTSLPRFAYFPFGGGPRICVGNHFAMLEGVLVLATLVRHRLWEPSPGFVPEWLPAVTLRPRHGIRVRTQLRG
jgi:cytochrome P450